MVNEATNAAKAPRNPAVQTISIQEEYGLRLRLTNLSLPRLSRLRSPSAVWGVAGLPGEEHPSLMIVRGRKKNVWNVLRTGAHPSGGWYGTLAQRIHSRLSDQVFHTRREAWQAIQTAAWIELI